MHLVNILCCLKTNGEYYSISSAFSKKWIIFVFVNSAVGNLKLTVCLELYETTAGFRDK